MNILTSIMTILLLLLVACAPQKTPIPSPTPIATPIQPPVAITAPTAAETALQTLVAAAKKEGKLTLYSFRFTGDLGNALAKGFRDKYGITTEIVTGPGSQFIERIKSENRSGQFVADALDTATTLLIIAKQEGVTQPWGELPVFQEKDIWIQDPVPEAGTHILYFIPTLNVPFINTNLVKPGEEPKSWRNFLEPKWKGKMVVGDPNTIPTPNQAYWAFTSRKVLGEEYWRQLATQGVRIAPSMRENDTMVARGEAAVTLASAQSNMAPLIKEGAPVKVLDLEEGAILIGGSIAFIKNSPHPNAARLFLNWLLSADGQRVYSQASGVMSIRKDVSDYTPLAAQLKPKKIYAMSLTDDVETARIQREQVLTKILLGK